MTARLENSPAHSILVGDVQVEVVRKAIKNLHLAVYPPDGRVRVATPLRVDDEAVRLFTIARLPWIRRQQNKFIGQERQSAREYVSGESHYFRGRRYRLRVNEGPGPAQVKVATQQRLLLTVPVESTAQQREAVLLAWYRADLKARLPDLVNTWSARLEVPEPAWGVKRMKTKWGSCAIQTGRIWLNLELAKKSPHCLEYVVVHELAHLHERHHNQRFQALLDQHLPLWRSYRAELNASPLGPESW
jgi:predicted metal-dependent hydrolase